MKDHPSHLQLQAKLVDRLKVVLGVKLVLEDRDDQVDMLQVEDRVNLEDLVKVEDRLKLVRHKLNLGCSLKLV